ncbi:cysteine desulfurase NifS [Tenacibaculum sp. Bg11-29]|uniref:cysteine desulfurase family protein n=1 Tax=Tenacibaculum sp. Bg11-29 TaxID=2058306 RepID=UPI000C32D82A|nr:cysteine desulfurase family protein [Tenacibaculum sp. Bg11-29]PKH52372.1 cysteine desulfurase NifS [Tenacibaculum sp. Bg11-29]
MKTPFIYLDYNASTPNDPRVVDAMLPFLTNHYGNPSSIHTQGIKAKEAIEKARTQVANLLAASPEEIIFTSGGTESNNYAIIGSAMANKKKGNHIITSTVEHPAVIEVCKYLETQGFKISYIDVDNDGVVNIESLKKAISPNTILITIMHANNEVGSINPIKEIGEIAKQHNIVFHTDASQSVGKIKTNVTDLNIDLLTIAGHKIYAPKGIGALYIKKGIKLTKLLHGASHESNKRPGTENVVQIVGLGKALEIAHQEFDKNTSNMKAMRDYLLEKINTLNFDAVVNGDLEKSLPNTLNMSFKNIDANAVIYELRNKVALSAGSACHSGTANLSNVLKATLSDYNYANGTFRFSLGKNTNKQEIDDAIIHFKIAFNKLKLKT